MRRFARYAFLLRRRRTGGFHLRRSRSEGGKAIVAMPSVTNKGISKIVPVLAEGAGVVTTRAHVHWIVTEHGAVNLYGKSSRNAPVC